MSSTRLEIVAEVISLPLVAQPVTARAPGIGRASQGGGSMKAPTGAADYGMTSAETADVPPLPNIPFRDQARRLRRRVPASAFACGRRWRAVLGCAADRLESRRSPAGRPGAFPSPQDPANSC